MWEKGTAIFKSGGLKIVERLGRYCVELGAIERFHSRGQHLCKFIETKKKAFIKEKSTTPTGFSWYTNTAAVSLFWNTNMADVASRENTHSHTNPTIARWRTYQ